MSSSDVVPPLIPTYIAGGRFAVEDENNHTGSLWISTLLCLVYSSLIFATRAHLRWSVFGLDDYLILVATVLQAGEVGAFIAALQHGLGQAHAILTPEQISKTNSDTFAGILLFIASTCFSKLSVIFLMMRLFNLNGPRSRSDKRTRIMWIVSWTFAVLTICWGIFSTVGLSVNCSIKNLTSQVSQNGCPAQDTRWDVITAFDVLTEIVLVLLSIIIVWPVQMKVTMKVPIVLAFTFRLPCAALSVLHLYYVHIYTTTIPTSSSLPTTTDPGNALVPVILIMQVQLCWSVISATIPNLKSFVRSFNSGCGLGLDQDFMQYGSSSRTRSTRRDTECDLSNSLPNTNVSTNAESRRTSIVATTLSLLNPNYNSNKNTNTDSDTNTEKKSRRRSHVETIPLNTDKPDKHPTTTFPPSSSSDTRGRAIDHYPPQSGYTVDISSRTSSPVPTSSILARKSPSPKPLMSSSSRRWRTRSRERISEEHDDKTQDHDNDVGTENEDDDDYFDEDENENENEIEKSNMSWSWNGMASTSTSGTGRVRGSGGRTGVIRKDMQYSVHYEPK